ncbi:MAG: DUF2589 domain-containing protein [Janthinobacterium lividum]
MPINMGDQFRGLPMADLIGGPLMAACDAQVRLANATAQFIQLVGFVPKPGSQPGADGTISDLAVRTVDFKFDRPTAGAVPDPQTGIVPTETVSLTVPLLAIVKVPALAIDTVDISFDMEVKNSESEKSSEDKSGKFSADASVDYGIFSLKVHVEGSVATHKENTRSTDQTAKYHVELHAADKGMPEGLSRVLDIMNTAIAPTQIAGPAASGTTPTPAPAPASAPVAASDTTNAPPRQIEGHTSATHPTPHPAAGDPVEVLKSGHTYKVV